MRPKVEGLPQIHLAVLLFSLAGLIGKAVALPPALIVLGRVLFASVALLCIIFVLKPELRLRSRHDALVLALLGGVLSLHWITFFHSIQVSTVAIGLLAYSTFPVFAGLFEPIVFHEKLKVRDILIACSAFAGMAVLVPSFDIGSNITRGAFWGVFSGMLFAALSVMNRKYAREYPGLVIALYEDSAAVVFLLPALFLVDFHFHTKDMLLLLFLGVVSTAIAHSLFIGGMRYVRARIASIIAMLEPVYGIMFALVLLGEIPSLRTVAGGAVIVAAAMLAGAGDRKPLTLALSQRERG